MNKPPEPTKYLLFIPGRLPGLNEIIKEARGNKYAAAKQKKYWTRKVADITRLSVCNIKPMGKVWIYFTWIEKNKRRDPDNICVAKKFIMDGLVLAGLLSADGWSNIAGFTDSWEIGDPGVWIEIREM